MKRAARVGSEAARGNATTDASDRTAAATAAQRCRVMIYGGRRPALWAHYPQRDAGVAVATALRQHGFDARVVPADDAEHRAKAAG